MLALRPDEPLEAGWSVLCRERPKAPGTFDAFYISPQGRRYRSRTEVYRGLGLSEAKSAQKAQHDAQAALDAIERMRQRQLRFESETGEPTVVAASVPATLIAASVPAANVAQPVGASPAGPAPPDEDVEIIDITDD